MIHAAIKSREISRHEVKLNLVKSSSAGRGAKIDFAAWISTPFGDPRGKIEDARHIPEIRNCFGSRRAHGLCDR